MFLPATSALGAGLYSVAMYGGLVLFGAFLLYDTQKIIHRAETHPIYADQPFDPVNKLVGFLSFHQQLGLVVIYSKICMIHRG